MWVAAVWGRAEQQFCLVLNSSNPTIRLHVVAIAVAAIVPHLFNGNLRHRMITDRMIRIPVRSVSIISHRGM